ncbi:MAG TPA: hypothetical protein VD997_12255 [Phycisphaerales bacterium]|nr:hypothetical protein [Phycisphaerales bacterium]
MTPPANDDTPSVHDTTVYAYTVDRENRRVILHTAFRDKEPHEFTDIVFTDVVAHEFRRVHQPSTLFDVHEVDLAQFIGEHADHFEASWRHDWPPANACNDTTELLSTLTGMDVRAFTIDASQGLSGWVLAARSQRVPRNMPGQPN